jgi:hypothetical protein
VERQRVPCGLTYGYRVVRRFGDDGRPVTGLREIDPDQAAIIVEIFRRYVAGEGPRRIHQRPRCAGAARPAMERQHHQRQRRQARPRWTPLRGRR